MWKIFNTVLSNIDNLIWGLPLMALILTGGIFLSIRLRFLQIKRLPLALKWVFHNEKNDNGEISSFAALMTALSATIGTGNIVGVATAVVAGGPGALFWMIFAAFFGIATKYSEAFLAVRFRDFDPKTGQTLGGPFYYIEKGMGSRFKWLAKLFAFFGVCVGLFGIGTFSQVNSIVSAVNNFFNPNNISNVHLKGIGSYSTVTVISSIILASLVALVVIGGLQRISKVASFVVPFMAVLYIVLTVMILILNIKALPSAFGQIISGAFNPRAVTGGAVGSVFVAMQKGIARGIFSNEAGLGSAPIAAATAQTKEPVRQGLVSMTGTFIDTIVICNMTGLSIVLTGAWKISGLEGVAVTTYAFKHALPFSHQISAFLLMICLIFFAFTTILGWSFYSERCLSYLTGGKKTALNIFRWLYIIAVFIGPYMTVKAVWTIADIFNGCMAIPNMIALFALSSITAHETKKFFDEKKHLTAE